MERGDAINVVLAAQPVVVDAGDVRHAGVEIRHVVSSQGGVLGLSG
jgi:hypothetical protein